MSWKVLTHMVCADLQSPALTHEQADLLSVLMF